MKSSGFIVGLNTVYLEALLNPNSSLERRKANAYYKASRVLARDSRDLTKLSDHQILAIRGIGKGMLSKWKQFSEKGTFKALDVATEWLTLTGYPPVLFELGNISARDLTIVRNFSKETSITVLGFLQEASARSKLAASESTAVRKIMDACQAQFEAMTPDEIRQGRGNTAVTAILSQPGFSSGEDTVEKAFLAVIAEARAKSGGTPFARGLQVLAALSEEMEEELVPLENLASVTSAMEVVRVGLVVPDTEGRVLRSGVMMGAKFEVIEVPEPQYVSGEIKRVPPNYHNHTTFSDGKGTMEEYIKAFPFAGAGDKVIGFSDHSPELAIAWKPFAIERQVEARNEIERLSLRYKDFTLLMGIELGVSRDRIPELEEPELFDYFLIGIHKVNAGTEMTDTVKQVYEMYSSYGPVIVAHPSLDEAYKHYYQLDLKGLRDYSGLAFEISGAPEIVGPQGDTLRSILDNDFRVILSADAHRPDSQSNAALAMVIANRHDVSLNQLLTI